MQCVIIMYKHTRVQYLYTECNPLQLLKGKGDYSEVPDKFFSDYVYKGIMN